MAAHATTITLDGDTAATGSRLGSGPLVTSEGTISFVGEFFSGPCSDDEFIAVGAAGNCFDIAGPGLTSTLSFDFDVASISFIYGGNSGGIVVQAFDIFGGLVDSFTQADTADGQPAGPETLSGMGIRSLSWFDTGTSFNYAALDNIVLTTTPAIPVPPALPLLGAALIGLGALGRRSRRQSA